MNDLVIILQIIIHEQLVELSERTDHSISERSFAQIEFSMNFRQLFDLVKIIENLQFLNRGQQAQKETQTRR